MTVAVPSFLAFSYAGDGVTTSFTYGNFVHEAADLVVILEDADGAQTVQTLNVDYTVTGVGGSTADAVFVTPPTGTETVRLYRATAKKQTVDLADSARNPAETTETQLDRIVRITQDLGYESDRSLKRPVGAVPFIGDRWLTTDDNGNIVEGGSSSAVFDAAASAEADRIAAQEARNGAVDAEGAAEESATDAAQALTDFQALAATFGSAAFENAEDFASIAQGIKADLSGLGDTFDNTAVGDLDALDDLTRIVSASPTAVGFPSSIFNAQIKVLHFGGQGLRAFQLAFPWVQTQTVANLGSGIAYRARTIGGLWSPWIDIGGLDKATVDYVDNLFAATNKRIPPVHTSAATNTNIASPGDTYDGYTLSNGQSVLLNAQSNSAENGIYTFNGAGVPLTRRDDQATWDEIWGAIVYIRNGNVRGGWSMFNRQQAGGTLGTTAISYTQISDNNVSPALLPALSADRMMVDNAAGTAREMKTFAEVATLLGVRATEAISVSAVEAANVPASADYIRTSGYANPGDFGGALYKRVGSEPSHPGKIQSLDGAWWEIAEPELRPEMFGAVGNNSTDDRQAILDCWSALPSSAGVIKLRGRYRIGSPIVLANKNAVTIRGHSTGSVSSVGAALNFYAGGNSTFANDHACVFRDIQTLNLEDFQFQWTNPASGGTGFNVANRRFLVIMDRVNFPSWRRVRGIPIRSSGGPNPINPICGVWYRAGQTWRASECQWTGFGGRHVALQSAGDPSSPSAAMRDITAVGSHSGGTRTLVTIASANSFITSETPLVINNVTGHTALNGEWASADIDIINSTQLSINVPYVAGYSGGGVCSPDPAFFDQTRRPDVAEHERCRWAGADTLSQDSEAYTLGPWSGSLSMTDCTMIFAKHAFRMHNHVARGVSTDITNADTTSAPGFAWLSGKGGEGMTGHCLWLEHGNHVRVDNIYFGTYKTGATEGSSLKAESTFLGPLIVNGCYLRAAPQHGVHIACRDVTISGSAIGRHGVAAAGTYDNLRIESSAADVVVTGNNFSNLGFASEPYPNTRYGINCVSTNNICITGNYCRGNTADLRYANGSNVVVANNLAPSTVSF